jgi:hypothetical protein
VILFVVILFLIAEVCSAQITDAQRHLFDYHASLPLDLKQKQLEEDAWARVWAIEYVSPRGGRVNGFLVEPKDRESILPLSSDIGDRETLQISCRKPSCMRVPALSR